jgi:hypothetical protein
MSGEPSALEKSVEEILVELMAERVMSVGIQVVDWGIASIPLDWTSF